MSYAKIIVHGSPITKSNFKLFNKNGRPILPKNSNTINDKYFVYEQQIAYACIIQNPGVFLSDPLNAILHVYYKSEKRHPDTNNITKSIFDGVEKSGLISNDIQIKNILIFEHYDKANPRFELELYSTYHYSINYSVNKLNTPNLPINYKPENILDNNKSKYSQLKNDSIKGTSDTCFICGKKIMKSSSIKCNNGENLICLNCLTKK